MTIHAQEPLGDLGIIEKSTQSLQVELVPLRAKALVSVDSDASQLSEESCVREQRIRHRRSLPGDSDA
jgi:hypothetical protein